MVEQFRGDQIETMRRSSRSFEKAWRIYTYPGRHTLEEVEWARDFVLGQKDNFEVSIKFPNYPAEAEAMDMVYAGLHHRGVTHPPEIKYKASQN